MDKAQALHDFWSSFGWNAYDEYSVPDDTHTPYITYSVSTDSLGQPIPLTASLWDRSSSWKNVTEKADQIAEYIGYGHATKKVEDGYLYITKGNAFAQRMNDPEDDMIKRIYLSITCEFLTPF